MKKVLSIVLSIFMFVSIFSTVLNLGEVSAAPKNQYSTIIPKNHKPSSKPTKSVTPIKSVTPAATSTLQSVSPLTSSLTPTIVTPTSTVSSSDFTVELGTINASPNEFVTVPLSFRNVPDKGILTFDMTINYDPNCLEYLAYEAGSIVPNPDINYVISKQNNGSLKMLFLDYNVNESVIKRDGLAAKLKFKVLNKSDKSASIEISKPTFGDYNLNCIIPKLVSGKVNISGTSVVTPIPQNEFTVKIGSGQAFFGDKITIPVTFSNIPSKGITNCDMTIAYDPEKLEYLDYDTTNIIVRNPDVNFSMNKPHDGLLKLLFLDYTIGNESITSNGTFVNLTFKVLDSYGPDSSIYVTDSSFGDIDTNPVNAIIVPGVVDISEPLIPTPTPTQTGKFKVVVGSAEGKAGDVVKVPITIENVPSTGIQNFNCVVSYDATKLEYVPYESKGFVQYMVLNNNFAGEITILFSRVNIDSDKCIKEDGEIANIAFKVLGSQSESTPIQIKTSYFTYFTYTSYYVKSIDALINSGSVNIIGSTLPTQASTSIPTSTPTPTNTDLQINVGSVEGKTGDLVTVPVSFKNVPKDGIASAFMIVNYDSELLQCVSIDSGKIVQNPEISLDTNNPKGEVILLYTADFANSSYIINDGVFANITFKVLGSSDTSAILSVSDTTVGDADLIEMLARTVPGFVDISGIEPTPGQISPSEPPLITEKIGVHYGTIAYPHSYQIVLTNIPSTEISSVSMTVEYDSTKLMFNQAVLLVNWDSKGVFEPNKGLTIQKVSENSFKIIYKASEAKDFIDCEVPFAHLYFSELTPSTNDISIKIKDATFADKYGNPVGAEIFSIPVTEVSIGTVEALEGSTVVVPVKLDSVPQSGIFCAEMLVGYDPKVLEYVSYKAGSIMPNTEMFSINASQYSDKLILYLDTHLNSITTKGDIAYLTFKVKDASGFSPIKFESIPQVLTSVGLDSKVISTDGGVKILDQELLGYTVSGCVYSDLANTNLSKLSFNEGFKVELAGTALSALTDSKGYFEIKNVPVRKYTVVITKANCLERSIENISVDKDKVLSSASNPIILWSGDINENGKNDGAINLEDIMEICKAFNSVSGDGKYKAGLDLNKDGAINLEDVMIVVKNFNKCSSDYQ